MMISTPGAGVRRTEAQEQILKTEIATSLRSSQRQEGGVRHPKNGCGLRHSKNECLKGCLKAGMIGNPKGDNRQGINGSHNIPGMGARAAS